MGMCSNFKIYKEKGKTVETLYFDKDTLCHIGAGVGGQGWLTALSHN